MENRRGCGRMWITLSIDVIVFALPNLRITLHFLLIPLYNNYDYDTGHFSTIVFIERENQKKKLFVPLHYWFWVVEIHNIHFIYITNFFPSDFFQPTSWSSPYTSYPSCESIYLRMLSHPSPKSAVCRITLSLPALVPVFYRRTL